MDDLTNWLLEGPSCVGYRTRIDLLGQPENDPDVVAARKAMLADPQVKSMLEELAAWPCAPLKRINDAKHPLHNLTFLARPGAESQRPSLEIRHRTHPGAPVTGRRFSDHRQYSNVLRRQRGRRMAMDALRCPRNPVRLVEIWPGN